MFCNCQEEMVSSYKWSRNCWVKSNENFCTTEKSQSLRKAFTDDKISRQCHHCKKFDIRVFVLRPLLFFSRGGITQALGSECKTDGADFQDWIYYQKYVTWRKSARLLKP